MKGADKDHKIGFNVGTGPPLRPIVGANEAPNAQISEIMTEILQALALEMDKTENVMCLSTEEMLYEINRVNNDANDDDDDEEKVIIGLDYDKMFPSLHIPTVCAAAAEELTNSNLELDVDVLELSLYITIMYDRNHLINVGLGDVTHTRLYNRGAKPGITTPEIVSRSHDTQSKFVPPLRHPNN